MLPKPEPFRPSTRDEEFAQWPQWSWAFEQYLSCLDPSFDKELHEYARQSTPVLLESLSEQAKARSRIVYGMLNGLLYERGRRLLRSVPSQNGFEAWRLLSNDLMPKTRNRVLALLRTINSWPSFDAKQGIAQQLLRLEAAFEEYAQLERGGLPENNKMATLLSCLTGQLRQHANVVISDDSTYRDLRELVLRWDGAQTKWQSSVASSYGLYEGKKGLHDPGDVVPMEVDRVAKGGRGKYKGGKGKGDKGGKGKGKGDKGGRTDKGKGKGDKGGKAKGDSQALCGWCHKPGHFKRDCYQYKAFLDGKTKGARQVQASAASDAGSSTTLPSSASALQAQQGKSDHPAVRRVTAEPMMFDMSDLADVLSLEPNVRMLTVTAPQSFRMDSGDSNGDWTLPPPDYAELDLQSTVAPQFVRTVSSPSHSVIIDSGADISCIPASFQACGRAASARPLQVCDAQGGAMHVQAERLVDFVLHGGPKPVVIRERCVVANVTQPLLSLGRLTHRGWWPVCKGETAGSGGMALVHHATGAEVPLLLKGYSWAVDAQIRRVEQEGGSPDSPQQHSQVASIQVKLDPDALEAIEYGWHIGATGHFVWRGRSSRFLDPSLIAPIAWPYRSTLMQRSGTWFLLEHCVPWTQIRDVEATLPGGQVAEVITYLHVKVEPVTEIGVQLPEGMLEPEGLPEPNFYSFYRKREQDPPGPVEQDRVVPEEVVMQGLEDVSGEAAGPVHRPLPDQVEVDESAPAGEVEPVSLDGVVLSDDSSLAVLKTAAAKLNLSTAGSKTRLFTRIKNYLDKQRLALELELAADAQTVGERQPRVQPVPREPTPQERLLHECTHVPYQAWCEHCIAMRAVPDRMEFLKQGPRDVPVVQFDFCFTGYTVDKGMVSLDSAPENAQQALKCLVCHDSATGSIGAIPCEAKGDTRYLGIELQRFIQGLGHSTICLKCDNEPSTLALQKAIVAARQRLGLRTITQNPAIGAKGSLGFCEKAVDSVRKLANTLLDQARSRTGLPLPVSHCLFAWAFVHSAWLINRYRVIGNMTAYERATGASYGGRIAPFAEPVYCQVEAKQKGDKRWLLGILVGKSSSNDMYVIAGKDGIRLSRSIRRVGRPWSTEALLYNELKGFPWDYGSGVVGTKFVAMPKQRLPDVVPAPAVEPAEPSVIPAVAPAVLLGGDTDVSAPVDRSSRRVPPPESARVIPNTADSSMAVDEPGANPPMREGVPSTPEAMLPPLKKLCLRAVTFGSQTYEVNDESEFNLDQPDGWDTEANLWSMPSEKDESFTDDVVAAPGEDDERLWFPDNGREPELDSAILAELDDLADSVEVARLIKKSVLRAATPNEDVSLMKGLTTKFVRTWRFKKRKGVGMWYRRSRLCAREFRWLDDSKEGLFSPATSTDIVRLLPALFLTWKKTRPSEQFALVALDIKDAYLEVPQPVPVVSRIQGQDFVFQKMVPGQREGSQQWFNYFYDFLAEHFEVEKCKECPAVIRFSSKSTSVHASESKGPGMIHVDDSLLLLPLDWARDCFIPTVQQRFQITYELAYEVGHSFSFLKRLHTLTEHGITIRQPTSYITHMKEIMNVKENVRQREPCWSELRAKDTTCELDHVEASKFRQAVGTALYISCDRPDVGYAVRMLAAYMARPTEHAKIGLTKLIQYLVNTAHYGIAMKATAPGSKKLFEHGSEDDSERFVLEAFSDADWSGSKRDRRSYGGASYCLNGQYIHYVCRSQKCISLSSMESEYYSAVGSSCQGLFMKAVVEFMSRSPCDLIVYVDNQSCKAFCLRQGVTKACKHFEGRLLWLQDAVQQKRLIMKYVSTHANLGDIHTKPLSPARLQSLLFLHDFVDMHDRPVGSEEWDRTMATEGMKAQVKRVRTVVGGDASSTWVKRVALLLMMMPIPSEAVTSAYSPRSWMCSFVLFLVCLAFCIGSGTESDDHDGWMLVPQHDRLLYCRETLYAIAGMILSYVSWSLGSQGYGAGVEAEMNSTTQTTTAGGGDTAVMPTVIGAMLVMTILGGILVMLTMRVKKLEALLADAQQATADASSRVSRDLARQLEQARRQNRALETELIRARERAGPPAQVVITGRGRCFHHENCHVHQNNPNKVLTPCSYCQHMFFE